MCKECKDYINLIKQYATPPMTCQAEKKRKDFIEQFARRNPLKV